MIKFILKKFPDLERYNQVLWAVIGSGVVASVVFTVIAGLAAILLSLINSGQSGMQVAVIDENAAEGIERKSSLYDFCQPLDVHDTPYQLIRVVSDRFSVLKVAAEMKVSKRAYNSYSDEAPAYGACGIHGSNRSTGMVNVIIRHVDNNSMRLLLKENAVIRVVEYPQPPVKREYGENAVAFPPAGVLYWEIAFEDSNSDNMIDELDDLGAYFSDPDGHNLERITPASSRVLEKSYDRKRNLLTMRILRDTNSDKILDDKDKPSLIEVSVAKRKMIHEVLDSKTLTGLMHQAEPKRQIQ